MIEPIAPFNAEAQPGSTEKNRRWSRRLLIGLVGLLAAAAVILLLTPTALSTAAGTRVVLSIANGRIPGSLHADDLSLGWFSGQWAQGLTLQGPDGQQVLTAQRIEAPAVTLLSLLTGGRNLGTLRFVNPVARIEQYADGSNSLSNALSTPPPPPAHRTQGPPTARTSTRKTTSLAQLRTTVELVDGRLALQSPRLPAVEFTGLSTTVSISGTQRFSAQIKAHIQQAHIDGTVEGSFSARELAGPDGGLALGHAEIDTEITLSNIPVTLVDRFFDQEGRLAALLGPVLNGQLVASGRVPQLNAKIWANSQNLKSLIGIKADTHGMQLNPDSVVQVRVVPAAWEVVSQWAHWGPSQLANPFNVKLSVSELSAGFVEGRVDNASVKCEAELIVGDLDLDAQEAQIGRLAIRDVRGRLNLNGAMQTASFSGQARVEQNSQPGRIELHLTASDGLDEWGRFERAGLRTSLDGHATGLHTNLLDRFLATDGLITSLGPTLELHTSAEFMPGDSLPTASGSWTMSAKSQHADAFWRSGLANGTVTVEPDSRLTVTAQPSAVPRLIKLLDLGKHGFEALTLAKPGTVSLTVDSAALPLDRDRLEATRIDLRVNANRLELSGAPRWEGLSLDQFSLKVSSDRDDGAIRASLQSRITHQNRTALLQAAADINDPFIDQERSVQARASMEAVPVGLLNALTHTDHEFSVWLGDRIDKITLDASADPGGGVSAKAAMATPRLTALIGGQYEPGQRNIALRSGSWIKYQVTPALFDSWWDAAEKPQPGPRPPRLTLDQPWQLKAVVTEAMLNLADPGAGAGTGTGLFDPGRLKLKLGVIGQEATVRWSDQNRPIEFSEFKSTLETVDPRDVISVSALAVTGRGQPDATAGSVAFQARIKNLFDATGRLDRSGVTIETNTKAQSVPTGLLDAVARTDFANGLGKTINVLARSETLPGSPTKLDLKAVGDQTDLQVSATIGDSLTLRSDAQAHLNVTPDLSQRLLKRIHPFLNDAASSTQPVRLVVKQEGFSVPLNPFSIDRMRGDAQLDLGTLAFQKSGLLNRVRGVFRRDTSQRPVATFTPMKAQLSNGVVVYDGMTMQMDNLVLEFRGRIDQVHGRLKMFMDVPGPTMARAFDLRDIIEPQYRFSIPIGGTIDHPEVDLGAVVTEVAGILAKAQLKNSKRWGGAAGGLLEKLLSDENKQAP